MLHTPNVVEPCGDVYDLAANGNQHYIARANGDGSTKLVTHWQFANFVGPLEHIGTVWYPIVEPYCTK